MIFWTLPSLTYQWLSERRRVIIFWSTEVGLDVAGITESCVDPPHGGLSRRKSTGELSGELFETGQEAVSLAIPSPSLEIAQQAILESIKELHRYGITSCQEAASNKIILEALNALDDTGKLKLGISAHIVFDNVSLSGMNHESLEQLIDNAPQYASQHVQTSFVKMFMDGVPTTTTLDTQCHRRRQD